MRSRSVSITGATGFVGWHLAEAFPEAGWAVRAIVRPGNTKSIPGGIDSIGAALGPGQLARAVEGCDVIVHAAGLTRAPRASAFDAVNVSGTRAIVDAANAAGVRLGGISSQPAIGSGSVGCPSREDDAPRPLTSYG